MAADQSVLAAAGLTHASSVMPFVRCKSALSATVTQALLPLNDSALPNFPEVVQVALARVPFRPWPDTSPAVVPVPSSNPQAPTSPVGGALVTVTAIAAEVVLFPAASRAVAVSVCDPFATAAVFHTNENGAVVS